MSDEQFNESKSVELPSKTCSECHIGVYRIHPELRFWIKCPTCGYTRQLHTSEISDKDLPNMERDPLARHYIKPY